MDVLAPWLRGEKIVQNRDFSKEAYVSEVYPKIGKPKDLAVGSYRKMQSKSSYTESCKQWRGRDGFTPSIFHKQAELSKSQNL